MTFDSEAARWTLLAVANIPVYLGLGSIFFGDFADFFECLRFWFTPDWISLFRGEWIEDRWSETKLFLFVLLCLAALYGEYRFFFGDPMSSRQVSRPASLDPPSSRGMDPLLGPTSVVLDLCA
jgi:hypothetical protein